MSGSKRFRAPCKPSGTRDVALSSDTNATRIYMKEDYEYADPYGVPTPHLTDWIRVRVTGPGATLTNTTLNSLDHLAAYASSFTHAKTHGIKILQPGTHKIEVGFDMNANGQLDDDEVEETCLVNALKVTVAWEAIDSALDTNPNWGGGLRIFPDNQSPTDTVNRTKVRLRATVEPATPNVTIHFKAFDVDDPTPMQFDTQQIVDPNWYSGNDNLGSPQAGTLSTNKAVTGTNGQAAVDYTITMKPGDNFRAAASIISTELNKLHVTNASSENFIWPNSNAVPGFIGSITPMLTVWRRLNYELDSMGVLPFTGTNVNFLTNSLSGYVARYASNVGWFAESISVFDSNLDEGVSVLGNGRFENGSVRIGSGTGGPLFSIASNSSTKCFLTNGLPTFSLTITDTNGGIHTEGVTEIQWNYVPGQSNYRLDVYLNREIEYETVSFQIGGTTCNATVGDVVTIESGENGTVLYHHASYPPPPIPLLLHDDDLLREGDDIPGITDLSIAAAQLARAYVALGSAVGTSDDDVPFVPNLSHDDTSHWQTKTWNQTNYWVFYGLVAFQPIAYGGVSSEGIPFGDADPNSEDGVLGFVEGSSLGELFVFDEVVRDKVRAGREESPGETLSHEITHLFGTDDSYKKGAEEPERKNIYTDLTIRKIRECSAGRPQGYP